MKVTRTITKDISKCYHECPYFELEGGPSSVMVCSHPEAQEFDGNGIISHPECDIGFPKRCPLVKKEGM